MVETWAPLFKHKGPGNHPSGSSQQAHSGTGSTATLDRPVTKADIAAAFGISEVLVLGSGTPAMSMENLTRLGQVYNGPLDPPGWNGHPLATKTSAVVVMEDGSLQVQGNIVKRIPGAGTAAPIGEFSRRFHADGTSVYHASLGIDRAFQGQGIGAEFTRRSEAAYRDVGIEKVSLVAGAEMGGFAWARAGYQFDDRYPKNDNHPLSILETLDAYMTGPPRSGASLTGDLWEATSFPKPLPDAEWRDLINRAWGGKVTPQEIATLGIDDKVTLDDGTTTWFGKDVLVGSTWSGTKYLSDDMIAKAQWTEEFPKRHPDESRERYIARLVATCPDDVYDTPVHPHPDDLAPIAKHGNHDQRSHGNWARGGAPIETGGSNLDEAWTNITFDTPWDTSWEAGSNPITPGDTVTRTANNESGPPEVVDYEMKYLADIDGDWGNAPRPPGNRGMPTRRTPTGEPAVLVEIGRRPLPAVFRIVDEAEYQQALSTGSLQSDERMNLVAGEGTVFSDRSTGTFYAPPSGRQTRILRFDATRVPGLRNDSDGYQKTNEPVPVDAITHTSPVFNVPEKKTYPTDYTVAKHKGPGNHPSGSSQQAHAGGSGTSRTATPLSPREAIARIQAALPNAKVLLTHDSMRRPVLHQEALGGITHGIERMAEEFPEVADKIVLVNGTPHSTHGIVRAGADGQTEWSGTRGPDGEMKHGYAILFNPEMMNGASLPLAQAQEAASGRSNTVGPTDSVIGSAEYIAVHEFGHAVHSEALSRASGEDLFRRDADGNVTDKNNDIWMDMIGYDPRMPPSWADRPDKLTSTTTRDWGRRLDAERIGEDRSAPDHKSGVVSQTLSRYAASNRAEQVAESFALRHGPSSGDRSIPEATAAVLTEMEEAVR